MTPIRVLLNSCKRFLFLILTVSIITGTPAASYSFTIQEEQELGNKLLYSVRAAFPLIDDPDIHQYINGLGKEVLDVAGIQYFNYHFFIINNKEFNAFAAPSGLIFFYSGLIGSMNSEDELLSVLAHEIGHVTKRHIAQRAEKGKVSTLATATLALAGLLVGGPLAPALVTGALATGQSIALNYSRMHEEEADLLAYDWMKAMNRDPEGQVKMLATMRRVARYRSEQLPQYLLTHPNPEARMDYVESLIYIDKKRGGRHIEEVDNFNFFRFKYRILSQVSETQSFRNSMANQLVSKRSTEYKKKIAKYGLALVSMRENDYVRSLKYLEEVMADFPDQKVLIGDRGLINLEAGNFIEAEKDLKKAIKYNRNDLFATFNLGRLMAQKGNLAEAEKHYKAVIYDIPEYSKAYYELGRIEAAKGQQGVAAYYLGKYNLYRGKLKLAEFNFKQAIKSGKISLTIKNECEEHLETIATILEK